MKALPDKSVTRDDSNNNSGTGAPDDVGTDGALCEPNNLATDDGGNDMIETKSSESDEEKTSYNSRRKSGKKRRKHHHHHHHHKRNGDRRRQDQQVSPIFLWAKKKESKIVRVLCEDYDKRNRIRLVKTANGWKASPRSEILTATSSIAPISVAQPVVTTETEKENAVAKKVYSSIVNVVTTEEPCPKVNESSSILEEPCLKTQESYSEDKVKEPLLLDQNDNSIELLESAYTLDDEDEDEEQRAGIDRALEFIDQDVAILDEVKTEHSFVDTTVIKLPEGTTIHEVKSEELISEPSIPGPPPPMTPIHFGEITIIPQQQSEPLNLETVGKRPSLEIRLQGPPTKKTRTVPPPFSLPPVANENLKREWDPLSELKEVLSDPGLSVPDPLLVPRARLAALVASPAKEIPRLLKTPPLLPLPDPDLLVVSLSHLRSLLMQQLCFGNDRKSENQQQAAIDHMMWLPYLSKDVAGSDAELLSMLSFLLPNHVTGQQSFNYNQPKNAWQDTYFSSTPTSSIPSYAQTGYSKSVDCCKPTIPSSSMRRRIQQPDSCCGNGPPICYDNCWTKPGYDSYNVSPTDCSTNKTSCSVFPSDISCCYPTDIGYAYNGSETPSPLLQSPGLNLPQQQTTPSAPPSPYKRVNNPQQISFENLQPSTDCNNGSAGYNSSDSSEHQSPTVAASGSSSNLLFNNKSNSDSFRPKIKVKQHLIDPNAKPKLLNIEGALHLARANGNESLLGSQLWHPLFSSQEKKYGSRWKWTTPATAPSSSSAKNIP
ncbi:uncharacterized protein LOC126900761 [Daktulosphaira vitifoliae]|uniref:uncharacterized protein LOC126900761 n=1 Tax=Daktulosphaira vitifoliae TaxID=58002 RepID=UPI0021A9EB5C|nr:uncharacterized protein LOC126900761 [Daktulosphaira vitifoliae]